MDGTLWNCLYWAWPRFSEGFKSWYCRQCWGILEMALVPQECLSPPNFYLRHVRSVSFHLSTMQSRGTFSCPLPCIHFWSVPSSRQDHYPSWSGCQTASAKSGPSPSPPPQPPGCYHGNHQEQPGSQSPAMGAAREREI